MIRTPNMSPKLLRALRLAGYPVFYLFCLVLFARLTFPYERVRDRTIAEFEARQTGKGHKRLEIDDMSGHWLFGIEAEGVRMISLAQDVPVQAQEEEKTSKPKVLNIDNLYASASVLSLIFGNLDLDFGVEMEDGVIEGNFEKDSDGSELEVEVSEVSVAGLAPLEEIVELPLAGTLSGQIQLSMPEGKLQEADGIIDLTIDGLEVGDGKAKIRDTIALPKLRAGNLKLEAEAQQGKLELKDFSTKGPDFQFDSSGSLRLRDPFSASIADLRITFKFMDAYKNKNDITRGLFGASDSKVPGLFDLDPKIKRAKAPDGSYGWRATGQVAKMNFAPAADTASARNASSRRRAKPTRTKTTPKKSK